MSFDYSTLITDRTSVDVQTAKNITNKVKTGQTLSQQEQQLFDNGLKGCLNAYSDLNRIESACLDLSNKLSEYGYRININTKTNWAYTDIVEKTDIARIKNNLQALKDTYYVLSTTPDVPSSLDTSINYIKLNNIEKIIADIEKLINNMAAQFIYCGTIYCGE